MRKWNPSKKVLALDERLAANHPSRLKLWKDPQSLRHSSPRRKQPPLKLPGNWSIVAIAERVTRRAAEFWHLCVTHVCHG
jgi:hypothetical protein